MAILLVEDNEINLEIERMMFESNGVTVESASDGFEAVELAKDNKYAMIVMDIQMPVMDGFTASEKIREFNKTVPIIALSANEIEPDDPDFIRAGMDGALVKPMALLPIQQLIEKYLKVSKDENTYWQHETNKIFDYEAFCSLVADEKSAKTILFRFISGHKDDCTTIKNYIENKEYEKACHLLHDIIGISGNLYCHQLYEIATILKAQLKFEKYDKLPAFVSVWNDTVGAISEHCNMLINNDNSIIDDITDWETLLDDFVAFANEFDVETTAIFNNNAAEFQSHMTNEFFKELEHHVNNYNYLDVQKLMEGYYNI